MSLLKQDIIRKRRVNKLPKLEKFKARDNKEYEIKAIIDYLVYSKETNGQMPGLYYFILWKSYPEEKSTWELLAIVMHF